MSGIVVLDCDGCQETASCTKAQKATKEPCPSIDPVMCCGKSQRYITPTADDRQKYKHVLGDGPMMIYECDVCHRRCLVLTTRTPGKPRKFLGDPVLPRVGDGKIPQDLEPLS
jgi:hypothetical protein